MLSVARRYPRDDVLSRGNLLGGSVFLEDSLSAAEPIPGFVSNQSFLQTSQHYAHTDPSYHTSNKVIVLDMDLTLVGELSWFSDKQNFIENLGFLKPLEQGGGPIEACSHEHIVSMLIEMGGLRPGTLSFLDRIRRFGSLIVVYTHSERKWAMKILNGICTCLGYTFFVYVLAREDCCVIDSFQRYRKSLDVVDSVLHTLPLSLSLPSSLHRNSHGNGNMQGHGQKQGQGQGQGQGQSFEYIMFDDNITISNDESLIVCPAYRYSPGLELDITRSWLTPELIKANLSGGLWSPFKRLVKMMQEWGYWSPQEAQRREAMSINGSIPPYLLYPHEYEKEHEKADENGENCKEGGCMDSANTSTAAYTDMDNETLILHHKVSEECAHKYHIAKSYDHLRHSDVYFERVVGILQSPQDINVRYLKERLA